MIARYQRDLMQKLFSEENRYSAFLKVENAAIKAHAKAGNVPKAAAETIIKNARFNIRDIHDIEQKTHHDVIAFTEAVGLYLGEEKKWFHYNLTSTDVVDTALSLIIKEANDVLESGLKQFIDVLENKAKTYQYTPCIGRTHGMHADITSFGLKFALYADIFKRHLSRFEALRPRIEVGKISGAVGNFANLKPAIQDAICEQLGLVSANISTQTLQRDRLAEYGSFLALVASSIEQLAVEIRHLSRTEVMEVQEPFRKGQKGSSAMPHKKNPIASENMTGCARLMRGYAQTLFENIALWHERDISHSSVERVVLPDAVSLLDYMLNRYVNVIDGLVVYPENMLKNIHKTHGVIFSQKVLHALIDAGLQRDEAYNIVQACAFKAYDTNTDFLTITQAEATIKKTLSFESLQACFDIEPFLKEVDTIFKRVGIT